MSEVQFVLMDNFYTCDRIASLVYEMTNGETRMLELGVYQNSIRNLDTAMEAVDSLRSPQNISWYLRQALLRTQSARCTSTAEREIMFCAGLIVWKIGTLPPFLEISLG